MPDQLLEFFTFLDELRRPYRVQQWGEQRWLFYWHPHAKNWVSLRPVTEADIAIMRQHALPPERAKLYDKAEARQREKRGIG